MIKTPIIASIALLGMFMGNASAGGLFGHGGVFRGDVGNWIDKHVEHPILTPVARATTVAVGAALATAVAGPLAAPVGAAVGQAVNQAVGPGGGETQVASVETGRTCSTQVAGAFPLDVDSPLGNPCTVALQNGAQLPGTVTK